MAKGTKKPAVEKETKKVSTKKEKIAKNLTNEPKAEKEKKTTNVSAEIKDKTLQELKKAADKSFKKKYSNKRKVVGLTLGALGLAAIGTVTPIVVLNANKEISISVQSVNATADKYKVKVKKGTKIKDIKIVELEGYEFLGYFKDEACTKPFKLTEELKKNATIYASYKLKVVEVEYTVIVNGQEKLIPSFSDITIGDAIKNIENLPYETSGTVYLDEACTLEVDLNATMSANTTLYTKTATLDKLSFEWDYSTGGWSVSKANSSITGEVVVPASHKNGSNNGSITSFSNYAFAYCDCLTSITIPNGIKTIDWGVFSGCSGLTSITIPNSVTTIGYEAFWNCSSLTEITIPNSITEIGERAFLSCSGLTSVTIPNSVTTIGKQAFYWCSGLTSITIPNSVTTIGGDAFSGCSRLTSITIPNSVTTIGEHAFSGCSRLTSITIPDGVTSIERYAFSHCTSLTSITIPDSVTSIEEYAFAYCTSLTSITIPNCVTTIGEHAFYDCRGLTSIIIPNSVTTIGYYAFAGCYYLTTVIIGSEKIANNVTDQWSNGVVVNKATTVYIKTGLDVTNSTYLTDNFTKQATSDKDGYDMWVRNS